MKIVTNFVANKRATRLVRSQNYLGFLRVGFHSASYQGVSELLTLHEVVQPARAEGLPFRASCKFALRLWESLGTGQIPVIQWWAQASDVFDDTHAIRESIELFIGYNASIHFRLASVKSKTRAPPSHWAIKLLERSARIIFSQRSEAFLHGGF